MPIRFVYFDLDDTLLDHRHAERYALADLHAELGEALGGLPLDRLQDVYHTHNVAAWQGYAAGTLTKPELKHRRFADTFDALGLTALDPDAASEAYFGHYARHWALLDGAEAAYRAVAERLPVGLLTNGFAEIQHAKLRRFPVLGAHAQAVVISEEVGHLKPHPKLFAHATALAGVAPAEILYVGDSFSSDVEGSRAAGWEPAWFTADGTDAPHVFRFQDWADLLARLFG